MTCLGEFGVVYRGNLTGWRAKREQNLVAVKTLKGMQSSRCLGMVKMLVALYYTPTMETYSHVVYTYETTVDSGQKLLLSCIRCVWCY